MYTEAGHPYFTQDVRSVESFEELICGFQKPNSHNNLTPTSNEVVEYSHGAEATSEGGMSCDPVSFAISLLSCGEYAMFSMKESYPALNTDMFSMKESYPEEGDLPPLDNSSVDSVYRSISSLDLVPPMSAPGPSFLDFQGIQFEIASEMRQVQTSNLDPERRSNAIEERLQKLSRYRKKKCKRNFGKTIKYACRKVLADSQPRVRGRFAKTGESEIP